MRVARDVTELVGSTPLVRINRLVGPHDAEVLLKLESMNPGGSVKDRPALRMIQGLEARGALGPGSTIIEATSGNTGVGLAMVGAARGYRVVLVMPEGSSRERIQLFQAFGARVELTPAEERMPGAIARAEALGRELPGAVLTHQFDNPDNPAAHREGTALEILADTDGRLDALVATCGTGGTIVGTGEALRQRLGAIRIVAVEPAASPVLSGGKPGPHGIPGMGPGFVPSIVHLDLFDAIVQVTDAQALEMARRLAAVEGLLVGPSSGAAVHAALAEARALGPGRRVVAVAPDTGERYLSTGLYDPAAPAGALP